MFMGLAVELRINYPDAKILVFQYKFEVKATEHKLIS